MPPPANLRVAGGGLAGCAAALSILDAGGGVTLSDPALAARHKVCGEFLSPGSRTVLEQLGVWPALDAHAPPRLTHMRLVFNRRSCRDRLPEPALGLSRLLLDATLQRAVEARGGVLVKERAAPDPGTIWTVGRQNQTSAGDRTFGFKAHFAGPADPAVELFFGRGFYVGIIPVEGGATNVCGLARESLLRTVGFDYDALLELLPPLRERTRPLTRQMKWLTTGPLLYGRRPAPPGVYPAGDSLSFIDPFTGSGMLTALRTGQLAGSLAVQNRPVEEYLRQVDLRLGRPLAFSGLFRAALRSGLGELLAPLLPGRWLFALTRPA